MVILQARHSGMTTDAVWICSIRNVIENVDSATQVLLARRLNLENIRYYIAEEESAVFELAKRVIDRSTTQAMVAELEKRKKVAQK